MLKNLEPLPVFLSWLELFKLATATKMKKHTNRLETAFLFIAKCYVRDGQFSTKILKPQTKVYVLENIVKSSYVPYMMQGGSKIDFKCEENINPIM